MKSFFEARDRRRRIRYFRKMRRRNPDNEVINWELGALLYDEGCIRAAEKRLDMVLIKNPHHTRALYLKGCILRDRREYNRAIYYFRKAVRLYHNYALALEELGKLLRIIGRFTEGWECLKKAYDLYKKKYVDAATELQKFMDEEKKKAESCYQTGLQLLKQNKIIEAMVKFQRAIEINPEHDESLQWYKILENEIKWYNK